MHRRTSQLSYAGNLPGLRTPFQLNPCFRIDSYPDASAICRGTASVRPWTSFAFGLLRVRADHVDDLEPPRDKINIKVFPWDKVSRQQ